MAHEDGIAAVAEIDGDRGGHADQARAPGQHGVGIQHHHPCPNDQAWSQRDRRPVQRGGFVRVLERIRKDVRAQSGAAP